MSAIYMAALSAVLRANFYYHDDIQRSCWGWPGWGFSRHVSNLLSKVLHAGSYLTDISAFPQILAVLIIALTSVLCIYLITGKKEITFWQMIAAVPIGLSPYLLECLSFKFDSPYMALSVFFSVVPLLANRKKWYVYVLSVAASTTAMSSSYQASSGIFPMLVIVMGISRWLKGEQLGQVLKFYLISAGGFLLGLLLYRNFFMEELNAYATTVMLPWSELISGAIANYKRYMLYVSLLATFVWGMAGHGYMFTNNSISHDSLREFHAEILGNNIKMGSGRIFTPIYRDLLGSDITLPWLIGLLALVWIGLAVYLSARIFRMKSKLAVVLMAGVFSTNVAVSATAATYIHDLDSYMFSLLCAVIAVYLWKEVEFGWLPGAAFVTVSIGIYQGYLFVTVTLVMMECILRLYQEDTLKEVFFDGMKAIGMILLGGMLYYFSMRILLNLAGVQLVKGDYNSMDLILHQSIGDILKLIVGAYTDCFLRLWGAYNSYPSVMIKGITLFFGVICGTGLLTMLMSRQIGAWEKLLCLLLVVLLPLGMNMIYVLSISRNHDLMTFPIWLFYLFVLLNGEYLVEKWDCPGQWLRGVSILMLILMLYGNVRFSNGMYMKKDLEFDAYLSLMTRIVTRMEMTEGYVPGETTVVFVGTLENQNSMIPGFKDYWNVIGMMNSDLLNVPERSRYQAYFDYILGLPIRLGDGELWNEIAQYEAVRSMPCYPMEGCIKFVDEILVVKLGQVTNVEFNFYEIPD